MKTPGSGRKAGTPNKATAEMRAKAREYGDDCIAFWADTLRDTTADWEHRNESAENLAAYGFGKPSRIIELQHSTRSLDELSDDELAERARRVLAQLTAQRQLPPATEGEEIVDGGVVIREPEPQGVAPLGTKPTQPQPNDL